MAQVQGQLQTKWTWHDLRRRKVITLAVDTEFTHEATHTIQVAARTGPHEITVQVYHAPKIRGLPKTWDAQLLAPLARAGAVGATSNPDQIVVRAPRPLHADLSPLGMVRDLFGIKSITPLSRSAGARRLLAEQGGGRTKQRMKPSNINPVRHEVCAVG